MLKPKSPQNSFYGAYLYDRIVPQDHLLRKINAVVDFSFVNELVVAAEVKMKNRVKRKTFNLVLLSGALLSLLGTLLFLSSCELGGTLTIENRSSNEVRIFYTIARGDGTLDEATFQGAISAGATRSLGITFVEDKLIQRIEARDPSGKVVFSHDYNMDGLDRIDWKIVIPP